MKRFFPILFFFVFFSSIKAQPIDWDSVLDRFEEKYQPEISPEWLFPIIFKNGEGARDTIYIGYHPDAYTFGGFLPDTIFGERWLPADTSVFQANLFDECMGDSICALIKSDISPDYESPHPISFFHGLLPIRMYFNTAYFRSETLPQYNPPGLPQLQGEVWEHSIGIRLGTWNDELGEWDEICPFDIPALLSDTAWFDEYCAYSDSIYIGDIPDNFEFTTVSNLEFNLRPWAGQWVAVKTPGTGIFKLFPNPAGDKLNINFEETGTGTWEVFVFSGINIISGKFQEADNFEISTSNLNNGIYVLVLCKDEEIFTSKFIVAH
jgi:Secretion system C-terminal sorting domain